MLLHVITLSIPSSINRNFLPLRFRVEMFVAGCPSRHHLGAEVRDRDGVRGRLVVDGRGRGVDRLVAAVGEVLAHRDERLVEQDPQKDQEDAANLKIFLVSNF